MNLIGLIEISTMYANNDDYYIMWKDIVLDNRVNKDVLLQEITKECSQMIPISQTVGSFKQLSDQFFKKWQYQITKLMNTQEFEYNPIWNRDGKIVEWRGVERVREESVTEDVNSKNHEYVDSDHEETVSAYDSSTYQPYGKDVSHSTRDGSENTDRDRDTDENESTVENFTQTNQGNVGVTTTQSMIKEERELYEFNIYEWIVKKYAKELFLQVW